MHLHRKQHKVVWLLQSQAVTGSSIKYQLKFWSNTPLNNNVLTKRPGARDQSKMQLWVKLNSELIGPAVLRYSGTTQQHDLKQPISCEQQRTLVTYAVTATQLDNTTHDLINYLSTADRQTDALVSLTASDTSHWHGNYEQKLTTDVQE